VIEFKEENNLIKSENTHYNKKEKEIPRCSSVIDNLLSKNKEIDEVLFTHIERNLVTSRKNENFSMKNLEQQQNVRKHSYNQAFEIENLKSSPEDKLDFLQLLENKDLSGELGHIRKQSVSSESIIDL
jgi:hypothetical protein